MIFLLLDGAVLVPKKQNKQMLVFVLFQAAHHIVAIQLDDGFV